MKMFGVILAGLASGAVLAGPAMSQEIQSHVTSQPAAATAKPSGGLNLGGKHDAKAPINVNSDSFEGDYNTKIGTYIGNVIVTQTDYKLHADKMNVDIVDGKPNKIFGHGDIVFVTTSGTATGDEGVYDLNDPPTITLTGKVVLVKEKNVMRGTKLVVDVNTGISHLTSPGAQGGRVQSTLYPKQSTTGGNDKKPAAGSTPPGSD